MTGETGGQGKGQAGRLSLRFASDPDKNAPVRQVRVRALPNKEGDDTRMLLLEARVGTDTVPLQLTASEAAELMFEIGFALEEAARAVNGQPLRQPG
jgi:hypothetical protein